MNLINIVHQNYSRPSCNNHISIFPSRLSVNTRGLARYLSQHRIRASLPLGRYAYDPFVEVGGFSLHSQTFSCTPNNYPFDPNQKYETDFEIRFINFHVFLWNEFRNLFQKSMKRISKSVSRKKKLKFVKRILKSVS